MFEYDDQQRYRLSPCNNLDVAICWSTWYELLIILFIDFNGVDNVVDKYAFRISARQMISTFLF